MFERFKKEFALKAPIDGLVIPLSTVPDPVFAQKMTGDGVAINPTGEIIKAPATGKLSFIFKTNHAFGMTLSNGVEILVHVGIDTVELNGKGFERLAEEGNVVKCGQDIIKIDRDYIESKGYSLITPVLITNTDKLDSIEYKNDINVISGEDVVLKYRIK